MTTQLKPQTNMQNNRPIVGRKALDYAMRNCWTIPMSMAECFESAYLRKWEKAWTLEQINLGAIVNEGTSYLVCWARGSGPASDCDGYWLSFREAKAEWGMSPVVIISAAKRSN